jgi:iron complex outermembrane receptor protein
VEVDWLVKAVERKNVNLSLRGNVTYNLNRVTSITQDDALGTAVGSGLTATANVYGFSVSSLCGYESDEAGNPLDRNRDGILDDYDKIVLGSSLPKLFGSLGATLNLYGLTADILFDASAGHNILNLNRMAADGVSHVTEKYIEKGDFVRLSHVCLSYRLPFKIPHIKSIDLRLTGRNLLVFTGYSGGNPDVDSYGMSVLTRGMDYGSYPLRREVTGGISIRF